MPCPLWTNWVVQTIGCVLDTSAISSTLEQAILGRSPATLATEQTLVCFRLLPKTKRWIKPWSLLTHISNSNFAACLDYQTTCSLLKKSSFILDCLGKGLLSVFFIFTSMTKLIKHHRIGFSTLQCGFVPSLSGLVSIFILLTKLGTGQTNRKLVWIWCKKHVLVTSFNEGLIYTLKLLNSDTVMLLL